MLQDFVILIGMASLVATVFHYLKLPPVVGFLLSGILIGPGGFSWIKDPLNNHVLTEVVAIFLMFTIGLEFSIKKLKRYSQHFLRLGLFQVCLSILVFFAIGYWGLNLSTSKSIFLSFVLSLSSTAVVFKLLIEKSETESSHGQASTSILLFQDLAIIPMMLLLPLLGASSSATSFGLGAFGVFAMKSVLVLALIYFGSEYIVPFALMRVAKTKSQEIFFFSILFLCIATAYFMGSLGFSLSLGAFIAGLLVSDSPYGKQALSEFLPLRDIMLGIFFVNMGMLLDVSFVIDNFRSVVEFSLALVLVKGLIIYALVWFWTSSHAIAALCGLLLGQTGEFGFLLFEEGIRLGLVSAREMQFFIASAIFSISLTPFLHRLSPKLSYSEKYSRVVPENFTRVAKSLRKSIVQRFGQDTRFDSDAGNTQNGHTIIVGYGPTGQSVARVLNQLKIPYIVIDINPSTITNKKDPRYLFGDATKTEILEKAHIHTAKMMVITIPGTKQIDAINTRVHQMRPDLHVIVRTQYIQQLDDIQKTQHTDFVVGEFETSIEVLIRVLKNYGVESNDIHSFVGSTRKFVHDLSKHEFTVNQSHINASHWEIFSNIRPLKLDKEIHEVDKSLLELNIRKMTGASVIAVYRESFGTQHPHSDFMIEDGDILYLLGKKDQLEMVENYLAKVALPKDETNI